MLQKASPRPRSTLTTRHHPAGVPQHERQLCGASCRTLAGRLAVGSLRWRISPRSRRGSTWLRVLRWRRPCTAAALWRPPACPPIPLGRRRGDRRRARFALDPLPPVGDAEGASILTGWPALGRSLWSSKCRSSSAMRDRGSWRSWARRPGPSAARPTPKQRQMLHALGYPGPTPTSRVEVTALVNALRTEADRWALRLVRG